MTPTTAFDVSTLRWVGKEIDKSLGEARAALEEYAEGSREPDLVETCIDRLRTVRGTLLMIELHGAAMFAEELDAVARNLRESRGERTNQACEALMSGLVALPDYLAGLQEGRADVPATLLPLMNDLRAVRDAPLLSETSLFAPGLERLLDADDEDHVPGDGELAAEISSHRRDFHLGLLGWFRGDEAALEKLESAIRGFQAHASATRVSRLFEAAAAVVEGVRAGVIEGSVAVKRLIGSLDRVLKRIDTAGEPDIAADYPFDLVKNLLYYVSAATAPGTPRIEKLKHRYRLVDSAEAEAESLQDVSLFGLSSDTYETVRTLLLGEITSIKDRLDVALHAEPRDPAALQPVVPQLYKISDTLGMVGMGSLRQRLLQQAETLERGLSGNGMPETAELMALASDLVFAESSIQGGLNKGYPEEADDGLDLQTLPAGELARYRGVVLEEIANEFAAIKNAVAAFVAEPHRLDVIEEVPHHLDLAGGALRVVEFDDAATVTEKVATVVEALKAGQLDTADAARVEALADAIAGIEYYVELKVLADPAADGALDYAARALTRVMPAGDVVETEGDEGMDHLELPSGFELPDLDVVPVEGGSPQVEAAEEQAPEEDVAAEEPGDEGVVAEPTPAAPPPAPKIASEDVDDEIHEIFVEEAREQLDNIRQAYSNWRIDNENRDELATLRRGFHTLKGSGRMVGAENIGEFAWSVENLLNRVIDGTVAPSGEIMGLLDEVLENLPELVEAHEARRAAAVDTLPLEARAFTLAGAPLPERVTAAPEPAVAGVPEPESELEHEVAVEPEPVDTTEPESMSQPEEEVFAAPPEILEPSAIELDPVLADIFLGESRTHVNSVRQFLANCAESAGSCEITGELVRAFHTLHGSANMAGVLPVAELSGAAEELLRLNQEQGRGIDALAVSVLQATSDAIEQCLYIINRPGGEAPEWQSLLNDLAGLGRPDEEEMFVPSEVSTGVPVEDRAEALEISAKESPEAIPDAMPPSEPSQRAPDSEFLAMFVEEARELHEQMESAFAHWQEGQEGAVAELQRILHTLKGSARLAGIPQIGDLSHAFETMLTEIPESGATPEGYLDLGRQACDRLMEQADLLSGGKPVPTFPDLVARLEMRGETAPAQEANVPAEETPFVDTSVPSEPKEAGPTTGAAQKPRREGERIRISTEMLDRMVDNVGEVSIYASRLSQQHTQIHFNLGELEQTVARLREQLRNLDIETEAQILYRYEREGGDKAEGTEDFDPLELDRFSTIQELSRALVETVEDLGNICGYLQNGTRDVDMLMLQQSRIVSDLQNELLRTRLVPFTQQVSRLERLVRQTCAPLGKKARLVVKGRETELDRGVLDQTMPLLEHLLRNAVSHGTETTDERRAADKPEEAMVTLRLGRDGMDVVLSVSDDGRGLDAEAIRAKAVELGIVEPDVPLEHEDALRLILAPGFSTASEVTQISGRGVGLDVVNSEVKQLGGRLEVRSHEGQGSTFTIRLPFSLAITDVLLLQMGEEVMAAPHSTVETVVRIPRDKLLACRDGSDPGYQYAGQNYPVRYFGELFGLAPPPIPDQNKWMPALLVHTGDRRMALQVDGLLGTRQIVVKSVGPQLSVVPWIIGGTILGDGRVALITDVTSLVRSASHEVEIKVPVEGEALQQVTVMVVDDSITVRRVTSRLLERHGMNVVTAKDGVEAVALLQDTRPDVMLLDIEMPRMDGFEVARHVRNNPEISGVPIIMITSRTGEKHRERAASIGVERYLGKPYQEEELMDTILEVLAGVTE
jgi:chemosensory pili system protein ChpA (sensor histidine kinase/response regulator)